MKLHTKKNRKLIKSLKVGDRIMVYRKSEHDDTPLQWMDTMDLAIGMSLPITRIDKFLMAVQLDVRECDHGLLDVSEYGLWFPVTSLREVKAKKTKKKKKLLSNLGLVVGDEITIDGTVYEICKGELIKGCVNINGEMYVPKKPGLSGFRMPSGSLSPSDNKEFRRYSEKQGRKGLYFHTFEDRENCNTLQHAQRILWHMANELCVSNSRPYYIYYCVHDDVWRYARKGIGLFAEMVMFDGTGADEACRLLNAGLVEGQEVLYRDTDDADGTGSVHIDLEDIDEGWYKKGGNTPQDTFKE